MGESKRAAQTNHTGERRSVVAQAVNALIASRSRHFISPSSSMWTWFIRALMAKRVGDGFRQNGEEAYHACLAGRLSMRNESLPQGANVTAATASDKKRCASRKPKLVELQRLPGKGLAADDADEPARDV